VASRRPALAPPARAPGPAGVGHRAPGTRARRASLAGARCAKLVGEVDEARKQPFLAGAAGLLFPIDWPEPFGLVMIEAMACGTPVIAYRSGSVPEVVEDGVTGFIVEGEEQAISAVDELPRLDRRKVRARFEARFSANRMARGYESGYRKLIAAAKPTSWDTAFAPQASAT